jgi:hypothetical protein
MNPYWVTVADAKAWKKKQRFIAVKAEDGKIVVVCNICRTEPTFNGWCSGAASFLCNCALHQRSNEGSGN